MGPKGETQFGNGIELLLSNVRERVKKNSPRFKKTCENFSLSLRLACERK